MFRNFYKQESQKTNRLNKWDTDEEQRTKMIQGNFEE